MFDLSLSLKFALEIKTSTLHTVHSTLQTFYPSVFGPTYSVVTQSRSPQAIDAWIACSLSEFETWIHWLNKSYVILTSTPIFRKNRL